MALLIEQFMCLSDNFGVLIHDTETGQTAAIDAPEEAPIRARLAEKGWKLDRIFTTHHHADHTDGNLPLKAAFNCAIVGPAKEAAKIPGIDRTVSEGDTIDFGSVKLDVLDTPGHTLGHITYVIPSEKVAFVGDTLFSIGCGRVIEGTMDMMWNSLRKLAVLPRDTTIYCGHEYTEANCRFALTIEPNNLDLQGRAEEVRLLRAEGRATLPTRIGDELAANPFLRADHPRLKHALGMGDATPAAVFAELRGRKDRFR
ncbi:MAG: hydroxyacylglutathione hydrolase [Bauldia sp.]